MSSRRRDVAIIGAGQQGRVAASVLEAAGVAVAGHYDDDPASWGRTLGRNAVLGSLESIPRGVPAIVAVGENAARKGIVERLDLEWVTVVHPFSWCHPDVPLGPGTLVCSGVTVQVGAVIGSHVILNNQASVGHDAIVGDYAHLTVSHLGGEARADEGVLLGAGSVVLARVRVGAWATVGAGSVVFADVSPGASVLGNPARKMPQGRSGSRAARPDAARPEAGRHEAARVSSG